MTTTSYSQAANTSALPPELQGWNWGAFLLNWIWGLGNRCYFALLIFVPFFGLAVPFVLGVKGNAWAWRNRKWQSVEQFQQTQKRWGRYALIAYACAAVGVIVIALAVSWGMKRSAAFELAQRRLTSDPRVAELLGPGFETGMVRGSMAAHGGGMGEAQIAFPVSGPKATGKAYVIAKEQAGRWTIEQLELALDDGRRVALTEPAPAPEQARVLPAPTPEPEPAELPVEPVKLTGKRTEVRGARPRKRVDAALASQLPLLALCFEPDANVPSTLAIKLVIAPSGEVQTATLEDKSKRAADPGTERCVSREAQRWAFPAAKGGALVVVRHTFTLGR